MKKNTSLAEIGERIRKKRKEMNIRQKEMAEALGIVPAYLSEIENGKGNPGPDLFVKLASIFNIDLHYLFLGDENPPTGTVMSTVTPTIDLHDGIDTVEQLVWLVEQSSFIRTSVLSLVSEFIIDNVDRIKPILEKKKMSK
jgi:transcriptional regulator with XRE-family HTH domain